MASRAGQSNSANPNPKSAGKSQSSTKNPRGKVADKKKIAGDEFMASAIGEQEWLKQSLKGKQGITKFDENGLAPIHLAAVHGRLECLVYLIQKLKVDVNLPSSTGWRPIHLCISNQTGLRAFECLMYLLENGADPSVLNDDKITPAHQAASEGHLKCLKALVDVGATINSLDTRGHMPIDLAKLWGHRKCARILASANWRQSKEFLAKEMKQLDKIKLERALTDLSNDDAIRNDQQFYGDVAFKSWLECRGIPKSPTGPRNILKEKIVKNNEPKINEAPKTDTPPTANSYQRPQNAPSPSNILKEKKVKKEEPKIKEAPKTDTTATSNSYQRPQNARSPIIGARSASTRKVQEASKEYIRYDSPFSGSSDGWYESTAKTPTSQYENTPPPDDDASVYQSVMWNTSTKIPEKAYTTDLTDFYPRDEYSRMPHPPPRRNRSPASLKRMGIDPAATPDKALRLPDLPADVIARNLEPLRYERPVVYKCKHIADLHRLYTPADLLPRAEVALHLANDPHGTLFQNALLACAPGTPSTAISSVSALSSATSSIGSGAVHKHPHHHLPGDGGGTDTDNLIKEGQ